MMLLLSLLFGLLTLLTISLERTYYRVRPKELKRRAREGDVFAKTLYRAVAFGASLRMLLWAFIGVSAAGFFVLLANSFSPWLAFFVSLSLIWFGFAWLPYSRVTVISAYVAKWLAAPLAAVLNSVHPLTDWLASLIRRHRPIHFHSGLYRKEDLLELLDHQSVQFDNRMTEEELSIARHSLEFGDKVVREVMVPRRVVKLVNSAETVGPVFIDELHKSGHSRFPVYEGKKDNIVGTLYLRDITNLKAEGSVKDMMRKKVFYVHEDQRLYDVLQAILKTHRQLFVVVNNFEEFVGVIGLEDVIEQIIGKPIMDEFDQYEDLRAVAARSALAEHKIQEEAEKTTSDEPEVVE